MNSAPVHMTATRSRPVGVGRSRRYCARVGARTTPSRSVAVWRGRVTVSLAVSLVLVGLARSDLVLSLPGLVLTSAGVVGWVMCARRVVNLDALRESSSARMDSRAQDGEGCSRGKRSPLLDPGAPADRTGSGLGCYTAGGDYRPPFVPKGALGERQDAPAPVG